MKKLLRFVSGLLAVLVVVLVLAVASVWEPDRSVDELAPRWAQAPSVFLPVDGMNVHLRDEGPRDDPEPVVLLHGTSASLHTWDGWAARLATKRRVVRFDLPGFGLTGPTPDGDYTLPRYARFVAAVLDRLGIQRAVLGGNSFGGTVALATTLEFPARVAGLVLVDSGGYDPRSTSVPLAFQIARMPLLAPIAGRTLPRSLIESSVRNVYGDPGKVTDELVDRYFEISLRAGNRRAVAERMRQVPGGMLEDRIRDVRVPTLVIWGGRDRLIDPGNAKRFAADIAGAEVVVFDELGHVPQEEDPAATVAAAMRFLDATRTATTATATSTARTEPAQR